MFLEYFRLHVRPTEPSRANPNAVGYGLEAHAAYDCTVNLGFTNSWHFTVPSTTLLAVQQFFGACAHYGILTDKSTVIVNNDGVADTMWSSIVSSLNTVKPLMAAACTYDEVARAAAVLEVVVELLLAYPERVAMQVRVEGLRAAADKANRCNADANVEAAKLRTRIAELEHLVEGLRAANAKHSAIVDEYAQSAAADAECIAELQYALETLRDTTIASSSTPTKYNVGCPTHYDLGDLGEVLDVCRELSKSLPTAWQNAFVGGMYLELVKYVLRAPRKNGLDDLRKAATYIDIMLTELTQGD